MTHVPVLLAQYAVREGTPLKEWYSEFRELCGGLQCFGEYCPWDTQILHAATASLNRQYPEIAFGLAPLITGCAHVDEMWSLFDVNKLGANTSPAKRNDEKPVTFSQQPRVHAVSSAGQYDVTDTNASAYELVSDDEVSVCTRPSARRLSVGVSRSKVHPVEILEIPPGVGARGSPQTAVGAGVFQLR